MVLNVADFRYAGERSVPELEEYHAAWRFVWAVGLIGAVCGLFTRSWAIGRSRKLPARRAWHKADTSADSLVDTTSGRRRNPAASAVNEPSSAKGIVAGVLWGVVAALAMAFLIGFCAKTVTLAKHRGDLMASKHAMFAEIRWRESVMLVGIPVGAVLGAILGHIWSGHAPDRIIAESYRKEKEGPQDPSATKETS
jgi:hypothetical protein